MTDDKDGKKKRKKRRSPEPQTLRYRTAGYGWMYPGWNAQIRDSDGDGIPDHLDPTPHGHLNADQFGSVGPAMTEGTDVGGSDGGGGDGGGGGSM